MYKCIILCLSCNYHMCYTIIHSSYSFLLLQLVTVYVCQFSLFPDSFNLYFLFSQKVKPCSGVSVLCAFLWNFYLSLSKSYSLWYYLSCLTVSQVLSFIRYFLCYMVWTLYKTAYWSVIPYLRVLCLNEIFSLPCIFSYLNYPIVCWP